MRDMHLQQDEWECSNR